MQRGAIVMVKRTFKDKLEWRKNSPKDAPQFTKTSFNFSIGVFEVKKA